MIFLPVRKHKDSGLQEEVNHIYSILSKFGSLLPEPEVFNTGSEKLRRINELKKYLSDTDWYVVRLAETGEQIPDEIRTLRQQAREEISHLRGR